MECYILESDHRTEHIAAEHSYKQVVMEGYTARKGSRGYDADYYAYGGGSKGKHHGFSYEQGAYERLARPYTPHGAYLVAPLKDRDHQGIHNNQDRTYYNKENSHIKGSLQGKHHLGT